ncbi:MAG: decarboxylating 6-phosphogluconate dehydrogenase, partial [Actinobacteria bacterium]|nr:decarboxylating 6-phosphogluconate dehydrogenase [Actinomycetota bacterium]
MNLGMVGLGRMGAGMTERLRREGHEVMTYDPNVESTAGSLEELSSQLKPPRVVWVMVPAGEVTAETIKSLFELLGEHDLVVDGGNSFFATSQWRYGEARKRNLHFVDVGVSGGVWGLEDGFCLMAGGDKEAVARLEPIFQSLALPGGYAHVGEAGAGHYAKMVHNGIEYGLMQAYAEGFELMRASQFDLDPAQIAALWSHGSVVRSWLLELLHNAFTEKGADLTGIAPYVEDSGEGRWTVEEAIDESVPLPVITAALYARFASRQDESFAAKINA